MAPTDNAKIHAAIDGTVRSLQAKIADLSQSCDNSNTFDTGPSIHDLAYHLAATLWSTTKWAVFGTLLITYSVGLGFLIGILWFHYLPRSIIWCSKRCKRFWRKKATQRDENTLEPGKREKIKIPKGLLESGGLELEEVEELKREKEILRAEVEELKKSAGKEEDLLVIDEGEEDHANTNEGDHKGLEDRNADEKSVTMVNKKTIG